MRYRIDIMIRFKLKYLVALIGLAALATGCHEGSMTDAQKDSLAMRKAFSTSPVLSPEQSLQHFKIEQGFSVELVASEPLVQAPIAAVFDEKGRMWVVEMSGYMPDTAGTGETTNPAGKIVILEDQNHDGVMDNRKIFMDSLVLPRAICLYDNGILVAEPPYLWFVENDNGHAGKKVMVDSTYAREGNVEHSANGLLRGLDNWIYSANATKAYRKIDGKWVSRDTHLRGQWGISQDWQGRLFYNNNSVNLLGDYFLPALGSGNPDQRRVSGYNENIVPDNRTYPIRPTPGVNRGYQPGVLDDSLHLVNFTAACGPVIYTGGLFGPAWEGNAFVAEPSANLVKRNILQEQGVKVTGRQAYQGKEFLASDDERFRPENLYTGPDGAMYLLDMYRGIIQDVVYLTPYLKNEIVDRSLTEPLNRGRIYKIVPSGKNTVLPDLSGISDTALVGLLDNKNSWMRLTAQRLITDRKMTSLADLLRKKMTNDTSLVGRIHAFWTLEGLSRLTDKDIKGFLMSENQVLQQQGVEAAVLAMNKQRALSWIPVCRDLMKDSSAEILPYTGFLAASIAHYYPAQAEPVLLDLARQHKNNPYVADAVISGLYHREQAFLKRFEQAGGDTASRFYKKLTRVIAGANEHQRELKKNAKAQFSAGKKLFETYCQVCHGEDGNGITSLGAPLNGSPWVMGEKDKLLAIVLKGLTGPVTIGNKTYRKPEVSGEMPAFGENSQLSDEDLAQILSFIRNAWGNEAAPVTVPDVQQAREKYKGRQNAFSQDELK